MDRLLLLALFLTSVFEDGVQLSSILMHSDTQSRGYNSAVEWTSTRDAIIALRTTAPKLSLRTRLYVGLLGCARPRRGQRGRRTKQPDSH